MVLGSEKDFDGTRLLVVFGRPGLIDSACFLQSCCDSYMPERACSTPMLQFLPDEFYRFKTFILVLSEKLHQTSSKI